MPHSRRERPLASLSCRPHLTSSERLGIGAQHFSMRAFNERSSFISPIARSSVSRNPRSPSRMPAPTSCAALNCASGRSAVRPRSPRCTPTPLPPHVRDLGHRPRRPRTRCPTPHRPPLARHGPPRFRHPPQRLGGRVPLRLLLGEPDALRSAHRGPSPRQQTPVSLRSPFWFGAVSLAGAHDPVRCVGDQVWKPVPSAISPRVANGPATLWCPLRVTVTASARCRSRASQAEGRGFESRLPLHAASLMKRPGHRRSRQGAGVVRPLLSEQADGAAARRPRPRPAGPDEAAYHPYHPRDRYQRYRMVRGAIGSGPGR